MASWQVHQSDGNAVNWLIWQETCQARRIRTFGTLGGASVLVAIAHLRATPQPESIVHKRVTSQSHLSGYVSKDDSRGNLLVSARSATRLFRGDADGVMRACQRRSSLGRARHAAAHQIDSTMCVGVQRVGKPVSGRVRHRSQSARSVKTRFRSTHASTVMAVGDR
jgi:hypothetical protein